MTVIDYVSTFVIGGSLLMGAKYSIDSLQSSMLAAIISAVPLNFIAIAFIADGRSFKSYFFSAIWVEIAVVLSFVIMYYLVITPVQNQNYSHAGERSALISIGVAIFVVLSLIVYFSTNNWSLVKYDVIDEQISADIVTTTKPGSQEDIYWNLKKTQTIMDEY